MKKYNIGSPKRKRTRTHSSHSKSLKKYNIGPPQKVVVTPDTPKSRKWKELASKDGYEIGEYEPDDLDLDAIEQRRKLGISTPTKYTAFEENVSSFMREASRKKPLTDDFVEQVNEEAWEKKSDHSPGNYRKKSRRSRSRSRSRRSRRSGGGRRSRMRKRN